MSEKVVMIRTLNSEFIIGYLECNDVVGADGKAIPTDCDKYFLTHARVFNLQMTPRGTAIALVPLFPFSKTKKFEDIEIRRNQILLIVDENDIDGEIVNAYKSEITGIDLSAANKFML